MGAGGCIGGGCNTQPWVIRAVFDGFMDGDMERARQAQFVVNDLLGVKFGIPDPYAAASLHTSKLYLARKGVKIKPYQWGRGGPSFDQSKMDEIEMAIDAAVASVKS
jgi:dihydrodipicolinate synthase/N-acetylneuraminate lyase